MCYNVFLVVVEPPVSVVIFWKESLLVAFNHRATDGRLLISSGEAVEFISVDGVHAMS